MSASRQLTRFPGMLCLLDQVPFISLSLHWMVTSNSAWTVRSCTAGCEVFTGSHTGVRIGSALMGMLRELGIEESVTCITTDTAANQKNAVVVHTPARIKWLGCACHKTELTVNKFVAAAPLKKSLAAFSKLAAHLHKSALSQAEFEAAQKVWASSIRRRHCCGGVKTFIKFNARQARRNTAVRGGRDRLSYSISLSLLDQGMGCTLVGQSWCMVLSFSTTRV